MKNIPWHQLPRTTSPQLFQVIRKLLLEHKEAGASLIPINVIENEITTQHTDQMATQEEINTVITLLHTRGFIYRLDSGSETIRLLMKPELINQYASSIIQAARNNPLGIGAVPERYVLLGAIPFSGFERLPQDQEKIVLEATIELIIKHDLCFREMGFLVFPSQISVTRPTAFDTLPRAEVTYRFSGSIETIYASLVVRLSYTNHFIREDQWKYAVEFSREGIRLGFSMYQVEEGTGELEIFFYPGISEFDRVTFIRFVTDHLRVKGIDIEEHIRLYCHKCDEEIKNLEAIETRIRDGHLDIPCQYCVSLVIIPRSIEERYQRDPSLIEIQRELEVRSKKGTEQEVRDFKVDRRQYTAIDDRIIRILHLSDIHLENEQQAKQYRVQLETDMIRELKVKQLNYLIISGDISVLSSEAEYWAAFEMINGLVKRFGLDSGRVVISPGNHDLSWDFSEEAYRFTPKRKLPKQLKDGLFIPAKDAGSLALQRHLCDFIFTFITWSAILRNNP